ncbi:MAG: winged helix-turn-helix transcriptional regulator [Nanoarchaeota archaeon]|nr:winged helix-turn-helix transcriptional regulator [Nanoarchaeota archaeon]MBU1974788.1 winged helix-turn-helix transcriptional regulator [Nanoarchaeota archaeon]
MKPRDPENPKLTKHDQEVLKSIIQHAKIPDSDIAQKMGLSPQAVFKIRHKLEESGIIKGYQPVLDLKKLGIHIMVFIVIKLHSVVWEEYSDDEISERIRKIPYVINAYRIVEAKASHILLMGFRDIEQMNRHVTRIQTKFSREIDIIHIYPFSTEKVITQSHIGLLYEILDKKEFPMDEFFLKKK